MRRTPRIGCDEQAGSAKPMAAFRPEAPNSGQAAFGPSYPFQDTRSARLLRPELAG